MTGATVDSITSKIGVVGRRLELTTLSTLLEPGGPRVALVHGIGGIGKTTLLRGFASEARRLGALVVFVDGANVEPTEQGLLLELSAALQVTAGTLDDVCVVLARTGDRVVVVIDTYERLRLLDTWIRNSFIPELPPNVSLVIAGRDVPVRSWFTHLLGPHALLRIELDVLDRDGAYEMLASLGVSEGRAAALYRVTSGHPLALTLAASTVTGESLRFTPDDEFIQPVIDELARIFLEEVPDPETRKGLLAASVVRRTTQSLLEAMLPGCDAADLLARIHQLPFAELARDGLTIHETVQYAVATRLEAMNPAGYVHYRRAAAQQLLAELRATGNSEVWRYTADLLYLVQQPIIRGAFFPRDAHRLAIEPAVVADGPAIADIARHHEGPAAAAAVRHWWEVAPWTFSVARDDEGAVAGFSIVIEYGRVPAEALESDPLTAAWVEHLAASPLQASERTIMCRRWMSRDDGEGFGAVQAAAWLDLKRTYLEMRPHLRRVYGVVKDIGSYGPVLTALGFQPLTSCARVLDDETHHVALLDFGPGSTDGWLQDHLRRELGLFGPSVALDGANRELLIEGKRIGLTQLEYGVMNMLRASPSAVSRIDLIAQVWGYDYDGGSNVVDVVVAVLRRKLAGQNVIAIETVRGVGYRLAVNAPE